MEREREGGEGGGPGVGGEGLARGEKGEMGIGGGDKVSLCRSNFTNDKLLENVCQNAPR